MRIINTTKKSLLADRVILANTFKKRLVGLLGRDKLMPTEALVITHCQSIHMFFMKFPIDVLFVDRVNRVVGCVSRIKPFQLSPVFLKASYAIELKEGMIERTHTAVGDDLDLDFGF